MTDDASLALGPLEDRAAAMAGPTRPTGSACATTSSPPISAPSRSSAGQSQRLRFNVVVELKPQEAAGDDVDRILSYDRITEAIAAELAAERLNLLETLAERIAARILAEPQPLRVFLRIEKLDRGPGALGVEIVRSRDAAATAPEAGAPRPQVHCLGEGAAFALPAGPAVIVPARPDMPTPPAAEAGAARRIALLALEQAAWALAARHPGLTVVATRTELDWALKQGQAVVWAPTKIVLDTPGAPESTDPTTLAAWLAGELDATRLVVHGDVAVPAGCRVPVVRG